MFTGLVQSLAEVVDVVPEPPGVRLVIREPRIAAAAKIGDSIAINGCCLTVVDIDGDRLSFQAGEETLSRTNLGELAARRRGQPRTIAAGRRPHRRPLRHRPHRRRRHRRLPARRRRLVYDVVPRPGGSTRPNGQQRIGRRRRRQPDARRCRERSIQRRPDSAHALGHDARPAERSATA